MMGSPSSLPVLRLMPGFILSMIDCRLCGNDSALLMMRPCASMGVIVYV